MRRQYASQGQDSVDNVMQLLARLYAEGVSVDLSQLDRSQETNKTEYKNHISVKTGGEPFKVPLPPKSKEEEVASAVVELKQKQTKADVVQHSSNSKV